MLASFRKRSAMLTLVLASFGAGCTDEVDAPPHVEPTVDEDPRLDALSLSGTKLHVREFGDPKAPVIIMLHGGPGDDYRSILPLVKRSEGVSLTDRHRVIYWDQRGAGQSRRHDQSELSLAAYERDLDELIQHYAPNGKVGLIGHSWGGAYATMYMNHHAERVRGAVLLEPGSLSTALSDGVNEDQKALFDQVVGPYLGDGEGLRPEEHAAADGALLEKLMELYPNSAIPVSRVGALVYRALEFGELTRPFDFTQNLAKVPFEVPFVVGAKSVSLGVEKQERQRVVFPRSRIQVIADADHNSITLAHAPRVIPLLVAYFEGLD